MQIHQIILEDIFNLTRRMRNAFDARVRTRDLTLARARILLRLLTGAAGESQRTMAEALEIEGATLVRLLDGLEQAGCIERIAIEGDRRAKGIILTEEGRRQAGSVDDVLQQFRSDVLEGISEADLETTRQVILTMQQNLDRAS